MRSRDISFGSKWKKYTPTGTWTTNTSYFGRWRRINENFETNVLITLSGGPSGNLTINIPFGLLIDKDKHIISTAGNAASIPLGYATLRDNTGSVYPATVRYKSQTDVQIYSHAVSGSDIVFNTINGTNPFSWATSDEVNIYFTVPIIGWG